MIKYLNYIRHSFIVKHTCALALGVEMFYEKLLTLIFFCQSVIILDNSTNLKNVTKFVHSVDINTL